MLPSVYDCVIPAAGASSRMRGADGRSALKPLLPFGGSTLVETAVQAALDSGNSALLVIGHRGDEIASIFAGPMYRDSVAQGRLRLIESTRWEEGMLVSIQTALLEIRGEAFFIAHADMPFVTSASYRALAAVRAARAFGVADEAAVVAACGGRGGHPVLMPSAWIPGILALTAGESMRTFLSQKPRLLVEMGQGALRDIDTPEDYEAALEAAALEACNSAESG